MRTRLHILAEMRRRRVFRTAGLYIVGAWVVLQVVSLAFQSFGIADEAMRYVWVAAIAGFPLALVFGWRYDITAHGIVRTPPAGDSPPGELGLRKPDYLILTALTVIAFGFIGNALQGIHGMQRGGPWYAEGTPASAIAVLPLENLSGDPEQEYLSAGLHDALISTLARITRLRVTSRSSTRVVDRSLSIPDIARRLGVDNIIEGSVTREGNLVRVIVTLIDAREGRPIWSESYTREFDGLISMQNEMASAVAREIKVRLSPEERERLGAADEAESKTYDAYLRGMFQLRKGSPAGYRQGIEILTEAVENHPTSALAYAGLAHGYAQLGHSPYPVAGAYERSRDAAERAVQLDPDLPEAHLGIAMYKAYYEWDFVGAEAAFLRALELNPSLVDAHFHYAWLLELLLRDDEAIRHGEITRELNPLSPFYTAWLAGQYRDARLYDEALAEASKTIELNPEYPIGWLTLGWTYRDLGRFDEAVEAHEHLRGDPFWSFVLAESLLRAGRFDSVEEAIEAVGIKRMNVFTSALLHGAAGDTEKTIELLTACRDGKIPWFPWMINWFDQTKKLQDRPVLRAFADELGVPLQAEAT